jgi:hypothetical protein
MGRTSIPGTVVTACVLWIVYGVLGLVSGGHALMTHGGAAAITQVVFALAFLITGIQVLMGKASGLFGSGIACLLLAALGVLSVYLMPTTPEEAKAGAGWVSIAILINSGVLALAGILAIAGNAKYKEWRATR